MGRVEYKREEMGKEGRVKGVREGEGSVGKDSEWGGG